MVKKIIYATVLCSVVCTTTHTWHNRNPFDPLFKDIFEIPDNSPKVNIFDKGDTIVVEALLAGYSKENIHQPKVSANGRLLQISGKQEISSEETDEKQNIIHREFGSSSFSRTVELPHPVKDDGADAFFDAESKILTITLPKINQNKSSGIVIR